MSILVDSVRISAFGGLRARLQLDLTAPLTVIYAPNGTGKTSVIESVDWILGGDVREARCRLAEDSEPTEVLLSGLVGGCKLSASKTLRAGGKISRMANGVSVGEADFLQALAPDCDVSELSALARIPRLRAFLSSNRVLGIGSLSQLIDADNADARADAMADLTGTRAQRNAQKVIDSYQKRLKDKLSKLRYDLDSLSSKEQEYLEFAAGRDDAEALIAEACRIVSSNDSSEKLSHQELVVRAAVEMDEIASRLAAVDRMRQLLNAPPETTDVDSVRSRAASIGNEIREINEEISRNLEHHHSLSMEASRLDRDAADIQIVADALVELQACVSGETTFRNIYSERERIEAISSDYDATAELINRLSSASGQLAMQLEKRITVQDEFETLKKSLSSLSSVDKLVSELEVTTRKIARVRASRESLRTLKNEAVRASILVHQHYQDGTNCPACGHDWGNAESLGRALNATLSSLPESEGVLLSQESLLQADIGLLEASISESRAIAERLVFLADELERINANVEDCETLAGRFGFDSASSVDEASVTELKDRLRIASALRRFERSRSESRLTFHAQLDSPPGRQVDGLNKSVAAIRAGAAEKRLAAEDVSLILSVGEKRISVLSMQLSKLRDQLTESEGWIQRIDRLQSSLGLKSSSIARLDEFETSLLSRRAQVQVAQKHLDAAGEIQVKAQAALKAKATAQEAAVVRTNIDSIELEIARVGSIDDRIESQSKEHRGRLVESVGPSVSQLFQRMQVNRVFSDVNVSSSLELNALLNNHVVSPEIFSTGQRQDLALAFFLVRAYALGGTFLLDEPLAHLDDLNRVAVLDTLRALVLSGQEGRRRGTRLVLTTASWTTTRHIIQKFMRINRATPLLRVYQLIGNVSSSVAQTELFPAKA